MYLRVGFGLGLTCVTLDELKISIAISDHLDLIGEQHVCLLRNNPLSAKL